jgi:hypothetical protein
VDLRPPPPDAQPATPEGFGVLLSLLASAARLDGRELAEAVDAADLKTKAGLLLALAHACMHMSLMPWSCICRHGSGRALLQVLQTLPIPTMHTPPPVGLHTHQTSQVTVVGRFDTWAAAHGPFSGKVGALRRARAAAAGGVVAVRDLDGFVEAMHLFAIHHYLSVSADVSVCLWAVACMGLAVQLATHHTCVPTCLLWCTVRSLPG